MKKSSLGRRSSNRTSTQIRRPSGDVSSVRKSGIPVPRGRAQSSERQSAGQFPGNLTRANSASSLLAMPLVTPGRTPLTSRMTEYVERPARTTSFGASSIGTSSYGGHTTRRDNRPLQDKSWQIEAMSYIENVIWQNPMPMFGDPPRMGLKSLSLTNFIETCNILLKMLDKNVEITKANYIKELPFLLGKKMQYKGKIEKSWMIAISSPTAIPYAIGVLHFLACCSNILITTDIESLMFPRKLDNEPDNANFQILIPFFNHCLKLRSTNPENYQDILEDLKQQALKAHYEQDDASIKYNEFLEERKELESQFEKLAHDKNLLSTELQAEQNHRKATIEKMHEDEEGLSQTRASISSYQTAIDETSRALFVCKSEISSLKEERDRLRKKAGEITLQHKQIDNIKKKRESLEREIVSNEMYIASYRDMIFTEETKIIGLKNEIEQLTRESNVKMMKYVSIDPSLEKILIPQKTEEILEPSSITTFNYEECKRKLENQTTNLKSRLSEIETERKWCETEQSDMKTATENRIYQINSLKEERKSLLLEIEKERKDYEEELQKQNRECEVLHKELEDCQSETDKKKEMVVRKRYELDECEKMYTGAVKNASVRAQNLMSNMDNYMAAVLNAKKSK